MKNKKRGRKRWFMGITVEHETDFKEMVSALAPKHQNELMKKLTELIGTSVRYEVKFSNVVVAMVARRMVEMFCQEWYHSVPLVFLERDGKVVRIDWSL